MKQVPKLKATKVTALVITTASLLTTAMAQQVATSNGGFENGPLPTFTSDSRFANQGAYFFPSWETENEELPGWGVVEVDPSSGSDPSNVAWVNDSGNAFNNPEGGKFLYLGGPTCFILNHSVSPTGTWTPGEYQLTFQSATWGLGNGGSGDDSNGGLSASSLSIEGRYVEVNGSGEVNDLESNFNIANVTTSSSSGLGAGNLDWQTYTVNFTVNAHGNNASYDRFDLLITNQSGEEHRGHLIDDVSITPVPEPSSSLLLVGGLGGLIFRRRR